ncbi:conserved hypothetical protein [Beutenbergia cavernae DSM 12333]|uniref:Permease n=1 Tax=Beutenbergia cavernae (strain ATCC BAA-8 / DSM 12333 / CCUG 43141 / JCM 11478 / NBRC 16432 / NCIMB 13614 / HKI 0122) TaxID=471853 RepID=C5BZE0_BEUC1|nr:DUF4956 domain-containing protein [Beutenbergia cavernae]ACQ79112.1 conserved hypothetical protein [Beutenbergia cavernae DSM 12333]
MSSLVAALAADAVAITVLVYALYFRRHHRRDLALAYVALNAGVLAVTLLLAGSEVGLGLGLGLFGILSIIRLRSDSITQGEIAYYFVALALGLVNGLHPAGPWLAPAMSAVLVVVMFVADHPRLAPRTRRQTVTLDRAYPDATRLREALAELLHAEILAVDVRSLDLVLDTTVVDVRFRLHGASAGEPSAGRPLEPTGAVS